MLIYSLPMKSRIFARLPALFMALLMQRAEHKMAALTFRVFATFESGFSLTKLDDKPTEKLPVFLIKQKFHSYRYAPWCLRFGSPLSSQYTCSKLSHPHVFQTTAPSFPKLALPRIYTESKPFVYLMMYERHSLLHPQKRIAVEPNIPGLHCT